MKQGNSKAVQQFGREPTTTSASVSALPSAPPALPPAAPAIACENSDGLISPSVKLGVARHGRMCPLFTTNCRPVLEYAHACTYISLRNYRRSVAEGSKYPQVPQTYSHVLPPPPPHTHIPPARVKALHASHFSATHEVLRRTLCNPLSYLGGTGHPLSAIRPHAGTCV